MDILKALYLADWLYFMHYIRQRQIIVEIRERRRTQISFVSVKANQETYLTAEDNGGKDSFSSTVRH